MPLSTSYVCYRFDVEMKDYIQQLADKLANKVQRQRDSKPATGMCDVFQLC